MKERKRVRAVPPVAPDDNKFIPEIELNVSKLPSRGLSYPKNAWLKYRTYTFGEIRKASTSTVSTRSSIELAISGIKANFPIKSLTVMDCLYIGILRKISSLNGLKFEVPYICSTCNEKSNKIFTQDDIEFRDIPMEVTELPIVCEIGGKELHFKPMTVSDYLTLSDGTYDSILKEGKIDRVAIQACSIKNMSFNEAYSFLYDIINKEDIEVLTEIDKLLLHDIKSLDVICNKNINGKICGGKNSIKLEGREVLINPFRSSKGSSRTRIQFGTTSKPKPLSN